MTLVRRLYFVLVLLLPIIGNAQAFRVGEVVSVPDDMQLVRLASYVDGSSWLLFTDKEAQHFRLVHVDKDLKTGGEWEFNDPVRQVLGYSLGCLDGRGELLLTIYDPEQQKAFVELTTFSAAGAPSMEVIYETADASSRRQPNAWLTQAPDRSHLLAFIEPPEDREENEHVVFKVFNKEGLLWEREETLNFPCKRNRTNRVAVDTAGEVYMLKRFSKMGISQYLIYHGNDEKWQSENLGIPAQRIGDVGILVNQKGEFIVAGLTGTTENLHHYDGYFYYLYNSGLKQQVGVIGSFPEELFSKTVERYKSGNPVFEGFYMNGLRVSGDAPIIAIEQVEEKNKGGDIEYEFGAVGMVRLDRKGNLVEVQGIEKEQKSSNDLAYWSSFIMWHGSSGLRLLANELNKEGDVEKVVLFEREKDKDVQTSVPKVIEETGYGIVPQRTEIMHDQMVLILETMDRRNVRVLRMTE